MEDLRTARAREERLRQQMDLVDRRADEAMSVEERDLEEQEAGEPSEFLPEEPSKGLGLNLSPHTWSAIEGLSDSFWEAIPPADTDVTATSVVRSS